MTCLPPLTPPKDLLDPFFHPGAALLTKQHHLKGALFNTCSTNNRSLILNDVIMDDYLDPLCLSEAAGLLLIESSPSLHTYIDKPCTVG